MIVENEAKIERELQRQLQILKFAVSEIVPEEEFVAMLRKSIKTGVPLRVKCGIDPTGSDVHLGHLVPYKKMRQFQDLGHIGVVIIGDYTASIGDPTGLNESRPPLDSDTVTKNAKRYMEQVFTVLDKTKTEIRYQSEWFNKVDLRRVIEWASQTTVAKLLSHETFKDRLENNFPLSLQELFYPVLQGVDSVYVKADIELGGSDQRFNVLMGRDYQKAQEQRQQVAILLPIILGTCGTQKMSKSLGNYIGILDEPFEKFGKIMSIPDKIMLDYFKYLTDISEIEYQKIEKGLADNTLHPNETKKKLAETVVTFFHGNKTAQEMRKKFEHVFKKKQVPDDIMEWKFQRGDTLVNTLQAAKILASNSEGRRLIKQNAITIVGREKIKDTEMKLEDSHAGLTIKIGKRKFLKLI